MSGVEHTSKPGGISNVEKLWATVRNLRKNSSAAKILSLKLLIVATLITAAVMFTYTTYNRLAKGERKVFRSQFEAVSDNALNAMTMTLARMSIGIEELSTTFGGMFPSEKDWPFVAWNGFTRTALLQGRVTSVDGMAVLPIVTPEQVDHYQSNIADFYANDKTLESSMYLNPYYPEAAIFTLQDDRDPLKGFHIDRYGNTTASPNQILVPIAQYTMSQLAGPNQVNYNLHGHYPYWQSIDKVIDCVNEQHQVTGCATISPGLTVPHPTQAEPNPTPTDVIAVFLHPIFPANNATTLVGFMAGTLSWRTLMSEIALQNKEVIDCVVEADGSVFTFHLHHGTAEFRGMGDLHERRYDGEQRRGQILGLNFTSGSSDGYALHFYPTWEYEKRFYTITPLRSALVTLGSFIFYAVLFACYDVLTQREFDRRQLVLDTKRRFVRFISHEIRTPLNTVKLGMKVLEVEIGKLAASLDKESPRNLVVAARSALDSWKILVNEIVESSESAVEVLNDLLNYDKIEVGTLKLEFSCFDVVVLAQKVTSAMKVQAQQKGIALTFERDLAIPIETQGHGNVSTNRVQHHVTIGDALRMGQVLRNLISNALKFTPARGDVSVTVKFSKETVVLPEKIRQSSDLFNTAQCVGKVFVSVKDTGAGLTPKQLEEICAEGVQFNANELQAGQGSGLGLFISKGIVEQHGGRLVVTSEGLGKGVTFTVELPQFKGQSSRSLSHRNSTRRKGPSVESFTADENEGEPTHRLLIVDDSAFNRKMLARVLASKGHTCEQAEDGATALKKYSEMVARNEAPDAILMDFEMPVMNGPSATAKLREMGCTCLIVGVTGNVMSADVAHFMAQGADHVLPKPLVVEDFEQLLSRTQESSSVDGEIVKEDDEKAPLRVSHKITAPINVNTLGKSVGSVYVELEDIV